MYGGQEKFVGQKVNFSFFHGRPILGGYGSLTDFFRIGQNSEKYVFLKIKTSTIKSENYLFVFFRFFFENLNSIL